MGAVDTELILNSSLDLGSMLMLMKEVIVVDSNRIISA
jgi:hypothetical protein